MSDEAFATELLRVAVSQICVAEGFDACEGTAADALVDVLRKYVHTVGVTVHEHCEGAQRTQPNLDDLLFALPLMRPAVHLEDLSDLSNRIEQQGGLGAAVCDIPPFPVVIPQPLSSAGGAAAAAAAAAAAGAGSGEGGREGGSGRARSGGASSSSSGAEQPLPAHVPCFMPPLPPPHSYIATQVDAVRRESSRAKLRDTFLDQKRQVQRSLNGISSASSGVGGAAGGGGGGRAVAGGAAGEAADGAAAAKRARLEASLFGEGGNALRLAGPSAAGGGDGGAAECAAGASEWPPTGESGWAGQGVARAGSVQERYRELELNDKILAGKYNNDSD
jgi:hypothetical protein